MQAYADASCPRICVVLRKAYGGAYIVMDSKQMGNDACFAWPNAEIAVMGAPGAVEILHRKELSTLDTDAALARRTEHLNEYEERFCTPVIAAQRGYVDHVIAPEDTRRAVAGALIRLGNKRHRSVDRRHANGPV